MHQRTHKTYLLQWNLSQFYKDKVKVPQGRRPWSWPVVPVLKNHQNGLVMLMLCPFWKMHVSGSILGSKSDARHLATRDVLFEIFQYLKTSRVRRQMVWVSAQNILDFSCKHVDSITCSAQIHTACSGFHAPWYPQNHTNQRRSSAIFKSLRHRRMIKTFCQWKHVPRNIIQLICTVPDIHSQLYARLYPRTCFAGQGRQCKWPSKQRADSGHVNKCQGRHSTLEGANLILAWSVCVQDSPC